MSEAAGRLEWTDAREIGIEGQGWPRTVAPYDRLPAEAETKVRDVVWNLSRSATGMCVRFRTNARRIHARWELRSAALGEANFPASGYSGLDLYGDDHGTWRWAGCTKDVGGQTPERCVADGLDGVERDYCLYLPLRNPVETLAVGVPGDALFEPISPRSEAPLVFYGTSIVHGAYASHPGVVYPAILGRRLQRPVINLGFSGNARMEIELAELISELDARAYIIDALPNMDLALVDERVAAFVRTLRKRRPQTPIVLVEDFPRTNSWIKPQVSKAITDKCRRFRQAYEELVAAGVSGLHYVDGHELLGTDGEASIDGTHPSDLGYMRMADAIEPVLARACGNVIDLSRAVGAQSRS